MKVLGNIFIALLTGGLSIPIQIVVYAVKRGREKKAAQAKIDDLQKQTDVANMTLEQVRAEKEAVEKELNAKVRKSKKNEQQ